MGLMQLSSVEVDLLSVIARIEVVDCRAARFDTVENCATCQTLDDLGLIATSVKKDLTVACMREDGRSELAERGFYRGGSHVRVPK